MNEIMHDEILDQPEALRLTIPSLRSQLADLSWKPGQFRRIIFTGSGDSFFAPLALEHAARSQLGLPVHVLPSGEAARYWSFETSDLLVAISISGEANYAVQATQKAQAIGAASWAVTANATSSLAKVSDTVLVLPFRSRSRQTPHTTDYMTTLAAVAVVIEHLAIRDLRTGLSSILDQLADEIERLLQVLKPLCWKLGQELVQANHFYFLGSGPSFANAQYGAAKLWEAGGLLAFYAEMDEFAHGMHLMVNQDDPVFVISPSGHSLKRSIAVVKGLGWIGARACVITDVPDSYGSLSTLPIPSLPEELSPFVTCIPLQWLCWAIASARGYDVVAKNGIHKNPNVYESVHRHLVRGFGAE